MSYQRTSLLGTLLFGTVGSVALAVGCAGVLGIEDADCDPTLYPECALPGAGGGAPTGASSGNGNLLPANGGGGGLPGISAGASGAGGGSAVVASGVGGQGGSASVGSGGAGQVGASAGAAGATSMAGADPVRARATPQCIQYCDTITAGCTGMNQQYASPNACLLVCELLPAGTPGATAGNNVACRLGRAQLAATTGEGANYCYTAGPGGGDTCGSNCDGYCTLMTAKCGQLGSLNNCMNECFGVRDLSLPPNPQFYNSTIQSGDSLQCRLFHVTASTLDPVMHCPHAAGAMPCL